jgi:oxygen-dependent protoporphyrinogen oxidase
MQRAGAQPVGTVVVIGAGITGLSAAYRLHADHPGRTVVVLEASKRTGGMITTEPFDNVAPDCDADAFLARVPEAVALSNELGLGHQLVHPATASALVLADGQLRRLPAGLVLGVPTDLDALAASGIVSPDGIARAAADLNRTASAPPAHTGHKPVDHTPAGVATAGTSGTSGNGGNSGSSGSSGSDGHAISGSDGSNDATGDQSVGSLVRHHLGDEVFEKLVAPLLGGVNAGDADQLSLAAGAPQLADVAGAPSLIDALRRRAPAPGTAAPVFSGFPTGTGTLINALEAALPAGTVRTGAVVTAVTPLPGGGFTVDTRGDQSGQIVADAVVMALPAHCAAALVAALPGDLTHVADGLASLQWASVAMVAMAIDTDHLHHPLDASGYLVPVAERRTITAASFASSKWAHLARPGRALLRVSAGHAGDASALAMSDHELVAAIEADLGDHLGLDAPAAATRVTRWERALPQYRPGHLDRARSWQHDVWSTHPGLWLTGASFEGLGIPACIRQATAAANRVAAVSA